MAPPDGVTRILTWRRQRTGRVAAAAFVLAWDVVLTLCAGAFVFGAAVLEHSLPTSGIGIAVLIWVLGIGADVGVFLSCQFRGFRLIFAVALSLNISWVAALLGVVSQDSRLP
jgi:hypothetical protein